LGISSTGVFAKAGSSTPIVLLGSGLQVAN
jgi:hypothetical protein